MATFLPLNTISSNHFFFQKTNKIVSAELSIVSRMGLRFEQLYSDAVDEGIALRSEKTGRVSHWYFDSKEYDDEGDLQYYILKPCLDDPVNVTMKDWTMFLFND